MSRKITDAARFALYADTSESGLYSQDDLAFAYAVSQRTISLIVRGRRWNHLPEAI